MTPPSMNDPFAARRKFLAACRAAAFVGGMAAFGAAVSAAEGSPPPFKITTKRDADTVTVSLEKDATVVAVRSPSGIGQAVIERAGERWPAGVVIRLHLKGLESFRAAAGAVTLAAAVSGQGDPRVRLWKDGKEGAPLDAKSPFWTDVRRVEGDAKQSKDGYFELRLHEALFEGNPKSVTLSWIDFYR